MVQLRLLARLSPILLVAAPLVACRDTNPPGGTPPPGSDAGTNLPAGDCPGEGTTICALKLPTSARHPDLGEPVTLTGVVITTPTVTLSKSSATQEITLAGFYVQDPGGNQFLDGRFSGILVSYKPSELGTSIPKNGSTGPVGQVVTIEGAYSEYGAEGFEKQKQLQATRIEAAGTTGTIEPIAIEPPDRIGVGGTDAQAYDGVLVKISEVQVTETTVTVNSKEVFGAFRVSPTLIVSGQMYRYNNPAVGEPFSSIAGVLRLGTAPFEAGAYFITPRSTADVVPKNAAAVVTTMAGVQDPTAPDKPLESCESPNGATPTTKCARARLTRMVVTAAGGYVSKNLRAMFIQDPSDADGRFAGVKVVYSTSQVPNPPPAGAYVDVEGEIIKYRGGMQIQYPTIVRNGTDTASITPTVVANLADLARDSPATHTYEGTLVRLENVTVTQDCTEDSSQRDHGYFIVGGNVLVGSAWEYGYNGDIRPSTVQCLDGDQQPTGACSCDARSRPNDQRNVGDVFESLTGVVDYSFGEYRVEPRSADDLELN